MSFVRKSVFALLLGAVGALFTNSASADFTIIDLNASGSVPTANAVQGGTSTTITGTNIQVTIDTLAGGAVNQAAFLNFTLTSAGSATLSAGVISQEFTGSFTVTGAINGGGFNYLSGTGLDGNLSGANSGGLGHTQTFAFNLSGNPTFTSANAVLAAIFALNSPPATNSGNFKFTVNSVPSGGFYSGAATHTYKSFTGNTTQGTFISDVTTNQTIPEPSSIALFGLGGLGLALGALRRKRAAAV